jgi:hypothetical protein
MFAEAEAPTIWLPQIFEIIRAVHSRAVWRDTIAPGFPGARHEIE